MSKKMEDVAADIVYERYNRARQSRRNNAVHQGKSFESLVLRSCAQFERRYTPEDAESMVEAFGFCPSRYYGLVQIKTNATRAWKRDLVINHLDSIMQCVPTPEPSLDDATVERIRRTIRQDLQQLIMEKGMGNPMALVGPDGKTDQRVEDYLAENVRRLRKVEQTRIVTTAKEAAARAQVVLRDYIMQSGFKSAYGMITHNQFLHGAGFGRFPYWKRVPVLKHSGTKVTNRFELRPTFTSIDPLDMYIVDDANNMQDNTANIWSMELTKAELINMTKDKEYRASEIEKILTDFEYRDRAWLDEAWDDRKESVYWGPDETIRALVHEGYMSGFDLKEMGVTGYDDMEYVNTTVTVVGTRTIQLKVDKAPIGSERTFFMVPFNRFGDNIYDVLGIGPMLWDTEQRINRLYHMFEQNIDWSARTPIIKNSRVLQDPSATIRPGSQYEVEEAFGSTGSMPEPIRPMNAVGAQYHLIMAEINTLKRDADEECGIPAFAYGAQDMGRASLGEYSQRMSNALRVVKEAAIEEDMALEPAWRALFSYKMRTDKTFAEGQDVDLAFQGITGLLAEDAAVKQRQSMLSVVQSGVDRGALDPTAEKFMYRKVMEDAGLPVDDLGLPDPVLDKAAAAASGMSPKGNVGGGQQVPQLDGRSGAVAQGAVAAPNGASTY